MLGDPNYDQSGFLDYKISKNCGCTKNCFEKLRILLQKENDESNEFIQIHHNLTTGRIIDREDAIYLFLLSTLENEKPKIVLCQIQLCIEGFTKLFCSENMMNKVIRPALKKKNQVK